MNKSNHSRSRSRTQTVPVLVDGYLKQIPVDVIPNGNWTPAHGTTISGQKVDSAEFGTYGGSALIRSGGHVLSMTSAEAEILAVKLAKSFGYDVTAPKTA